MDHSTPVQERRETHGAQLAEAYFSKMTLLVPAKGGAQNGFCQPAVERAQLAFVVHVLEVVVEDRDIANAFFYDFGRQTDKNLDATPRIAFPPPAAAAGGRQTETNSERSQFVARQRNLAADAQEQSQMAESAGDAIAALGRRLFAKQEIGPMTGLGL